MKFELRRISHYPRASGETIAFDADLYVNDEKVGTISNSGRGGANFPRVQEAAVLARLEAHCNALPPYQCSSGDMLPMNLDLHVAILVSEHVSRKEVQRLMKDRVLLTNETGQLLKSPRLKPQELARVLADPKVLCKEGQRILSEDEAVRLMADEH